MATWVRTLTTGPTATDANLTGPTGALSNATAPGDFDPDAVSSVRIQWTNGYVSGSFNDDSWDSNGAASFGYTGTTLAEVAAGATDIINTNGESFTYDQTDSSIPTGSTAAQWESAVVSHTAGEGAFATYSKSKGADGVTVGVTNITVTITYTPASTDRTARVSWAELETPNAPRAAIVSWAELEVPDAPGPGPVVEATTEGGVGSSSASFTATAPSVVNADDLLILTVATDSAEPVREATTTDWTLLSLYNSTSTSRGGLHVFYHWADGTEDSETWTFNLTDTGTETAAWEMMRISGADTSTNPEASGSDGPFFHMPIGDTSRVTTPDHADFAPPATTSAFDVRAEFIAWNQVGQRTLLSQWNTVNAGFVLAVGSVAWNQIRLYWSSTGADTLSADSTAAISGLTTGDRVQIRAVLVADNGSSNRTIDFYAKVNSSDDLTSDTGWTAVGTQVTGAVTSIYNSTAEVAVGRYAAGGSDQQKIEVHQVALKAAGTTKMWADFRSGTWTPTGTDAQGHTWTPQTRADHPVWQATSTETEGNPDPPSVTASWGTDNNLFIPVTGVDAIATTQDITAAPSGYSGFAEINSDTLGGSGPCIAAVAWQVFNAATQDPGVFTLTGTGGSGYSASTIVVRPQSAGSAARVSWAELEVPDAPRTAIVSWAELEVPTAPRSALVSWAELEVPNVPDRAGQVSWAEFEVPDAPRAAQISWVELEIPPGARAAQVTWAELEIPTAPRTAQVSWTEFEVPNAPRAAQITWTELEVPNPPQVARVSWVELEIPTAPRTAQVTWAEMELPTAPRTAVVSWAELEAPDAPRAAQISWAELEIPPEPRSALVSWMEMEIPTAPRKARISWAELEVQDGPRAAIVSWTELSIPEILRRARITWAELEAPDAPRSALVSWAEYEVPNAPRSALLSWVEVEVPTAPRSALVSWAELEVPTAPRSAQVSWLELEVPTAPRAARISWVEYEVPPFQQTARVSWAVLVIPNAGGVEDVGKLPLLGVGI